MVVLLVLQIQISLAFLNLNIPLQGYPTYFDSNPKQMAQNQSDIIKLICQWQFIIRSQSIVIALPVQWTPEYGDGDIVVWPLPNLVPLFIVAYAFFLFVYLLFNLTLAGWPGGMPSAKCSGQCFVCQMQMRLDGRGGIYRTEPVPAKRIYNPLSWKWNRAITDVGFWPYNIWSWLPFGCGATSHMTFMPK